MPLHRIAPRLRASLRRRHGTKTREPRVLLLHAGAHKTGSTSLQESFATAEEELSSAGILYPKSGRIATGHHNIAWGLMGDERFDHAVGFLEELRFELRREDSPKVLISSEDFECLYRKPDELARLNEVVLDCGYEPLVVLVLREPSEYAASLYTELVKHGLQEERDAFMTRAEVDGHVEFKQWEFSFDYGALVDGFARVFGDQSVRTLPYDPRDIVPRFSEHFQAFFGGSIEHLNTGLRLNPSRESDGRDPQD